MRHLRLGLAGFGATIAAPAFAHTGAGASDGMLAGFLHPLLGFDHLLAMVAVGAWAGVLGGRAVFAWPAAFVAVMILGAMLGLAGTTPPGLEVTIATSLVVLGALVAFRAQLTIALGAALCGVFALAHGFAHGAELPDGASTLAYGLGFVLATVGLHAAGVGFGRALAGGRADGVRKLAGALVAAAGLAHLAL